MGADQTSIILKITKINVWYRLHVIILNKDKSLIFTGVKIKSLQIML